MKTTIDTANPMQSASWKAIASTPNSVRSVAGQSSTVSIMNCQHARRGSVLRLRTVVCFTAPQHAFLAAFIACAQPRSHSGHLNVAPRWIKLLDCLPQSLLRQSEWYNDFVLACGVRWSGPYRC